MSTKPYLVINVVEGEPGTIYERSTWDEAVDIAVKMAVDQGDAPEADIREEIERDSNYVAPNYAPGSGWAIYICQAEND